jgi:hypothetical protein
MAAVTSFVVDEADVEPVREDGDTGKLAAHVRGRAPGAASDPLRAGRFARAHGRLTPRAALRVSGSGELELEGERHELEPGHSGVRDAR